MITGFLKRIQKARNFFWDYVDRDVFKVAAEAAPLALMMFII